MIYSGKDFVHGVPSFDGPISSRNDDSAAWHGSFPAPSSGAFFGDDDATMNSDFWPEQDTTATTMSMTIDSRGSNRPNILDLFQQHDDDHRQEPPGLLGTTPTSSPESSINSTHQSTDHPPVEPRRREDRGFRPAGPPVPHKDHHHEATTSKNPTSASKSTVADIEWVAIRSPRGVDSLPHKSSSSPRTPRGFMAAIDLAVATNSSRVCASPVPDASSRNRRTLRQRQLLQQIQQYQQQPHEDDDELIGSDHFMVVPPPSFSSPRKSPPMNGGRQNRRSQHNNMPKPKSSSSLMIVQGIVSPRTNSNPTPNTNTPLSRPTLPRSHSDQASTRYCIPAPPKDTLVHQSRKSAVIRSASDRGTPTTTTTPVRPSPRGVPPGPQESSSGHRRGGLLGDPSRRRTSSSSRDITSTTSGSSRDITSTSTSTATSTPRKPQSSRAIFSDRGRCSSSSSCGNHGTIAGIPRSKSRESLEDNTATTPVQDQTQQVRSKIRGASQRRHARSRGAITKIQKDSNSSKPKDDPLAMLYATLEPVHQIYNDGPSSDAIKVDYSSGGLQESAVLTREWTNRDVEQIVKATPVVVLPSEVEAASLANTDRITEPTFRDKEQESKIQRSHIMRSIKDLIKADKQNLKLEMQPDGTKRLVMDLSDLDSVMADFSISDFQY